MWVDDALVEVYASLFVHQWNHYAIQHRDGTYWRVAEPLTPLLISGHLRGLVTLGTYLLDEQGCCAFAVFDADGVDGLEQLAILARQLAGQGIPSLLEASRRGGHLWIHLVEATPAVVVRRWLLRYATAFDVELYPKQDTLAPNGSGSLIRLPLGIHRRSRAWYPFVQVTPDGLMDVGNTIMACCEWARQQVERVRVPDDAWTAPSEPGVSNIASFNQVASHDGHVTPIRAWCRSQDVAAVIGQYVSLNRRGLGSCPFKEHHRRGDVRPSFQVFPQSDKCWYCYTWQHGGDLFDFLCLYHNLSLQEGWLHLQDGSLI